MTDGEFEAIAHQVSDILMKMPTHDRRALITGFYEAIIISDYNSEKK